MSWYDSAWNFRAMVTVDMGGSPAATEDVSITIPDDWDHFWNNVQADGDDIRMTDSDGKTLLSYDVTSFNQSTRTGTIRIDELDWGGSYRHQNVFLYYGNSAAADGSAAVTITSAVTGYIPLGKPTIHIVRVAPEAPGATLPRNELAKISSEKLWVWFDFGGVLERRFRNFAGSDRFEEIYEIDVDITDAGASQGGMLVTDQIRFVQDGRRTYVRAPFTGGTDGTDYTIEMRVTTAIAAADQYRTFETRALLKVRDVDEDG